MFREVLLDTNFLMLPFQLKLNILEEIERKLEEKPVFIILSGVEMELKGIARGRGRDASAARAALRWIKETKEFEVEKSFASCDEALLERAAKTNAAIATVDQVLRRRALKQGIPVVNLKGARRVIVENV